jgi:hypothetical protein
MIGCWSLGTSTTVARRSNDGPPRRYIQTTHGWATSFGTCSRARGKAVSASRLLDYGITMAMLAWRDNGPLGRPSPSLWLLEQRSIVPLIERRPSHAQREIAKWYWQSSDAVPMMRALLDPTDANSPPFTEC